MALNSKDIPITREEVAGWLNIYDNLPAAKKKQMSLEDFLTERVAAKKLPDTDVNTTAHENLGDSTSVVDMILMDLPSYGRH